MNVEEMSRESLEEALIKQSGQLRVLQEQIEFLKKEKQELEDNYDTLSNVILTARKVLSC